MKFVKDDNKYVGLKVGNFTVVEYGYRQGKHTYWKCKCKCGEIFYQEIDRLKKQQTHKSCEITKQLILDKRIEKRIEIDNRIEKRKAETTELKRYKQENDLTNKLIIKQIYVCWCNMKKRCYKPYCKSYKNYGARGITVCEKWLNDVVAFQNWALLNGFRKGLSIDRIDPNGNYEPSNCRWVTIKENERNKRNNVYYKYNGERLTLKAIQERNGLNEKEIKRKFERVLSG